MLTKTLQYIWEELFQPYKNVFQKAVKSNSLTLLHLTVLKKGEECILKLDITNILFWPLKIYLQSWKLGGRMECSTEERLISSATECNWRWNQTCVGESCHINGKSCRGCYCSQRKTYGLIINCKYLHVLNEYFSRNSERCTFVPINSHRSCILFLFISLETWVYCCRCSF